MQHSRRALRELHLRIAYWWLGQQVEFLEWRLKLGVGMPPLPSVPAAAPVGQGGRDAVPQM